jgi:hypothetical protein
VRNAWTKFWFSPLRSSALERLHGRIDVKQSLIAETDFIETVDEPQRVVATIKSTVDEKRR